MTRVPAIKNLSTTPGLLTVEWANGVVSEFASIWLRDNLAADRDRHSGQRLIDVCDLPRQPRIRSASTADEALRIDWEVEPSPAFFDLGWLSKHADRNAAGYFPRIEPWLDGCDLVGERDFAWAAFAEWSSNRASRRDWLTRLLQSGIAFLRAVPATDTAILDAAALLGHMCETNYGRVFDVRAVPTPENLAYSDLGLGLHTDNPYREPVPGYQILHALLTTTHGGDSLFADGFAISRHLREIDGEAFRTLTQTPVPFLYRSEEAELYAERPFIQLDCRGEVSAVHYNNRSIAPLTSNGREAERFYSAYRRFAALLRDPRHQLKLHLCDGDLVLFDNQRILHGRTAFSSGAQARHLRGCYLTRDSVRSEAALLRRHPIQEIVT